MPHRWLAVDGALGPFSAAVIDGERTFSAVAPGKAALERGLGAVHEVLERAALTLADIDALAVGTGPGSFTGLRIAVSYAKGLALGLQRPIFGISSYDALDDGSCAPPALAVARGRPDIACVRLRTVAGTSTRCGVHDVLAAFVAERLQPGTLHVFGAAEGVLERLGERGFDVRAIPLPESPALAVARLAAARRLSSDDAGRLHDVRPDYGELPAVQTRTAGNA